MKRKTQPSDSVPHFSRRRLVFAKGGNGQELYSIVIPPLSGVPADLADSAKRRERSEKATKPEIPRLKNPKGTGVLDEPPAAEPVSRVKAKSTMPSPGVYNKPEWPKCQEIHGSIHRLSSVRMKVRQRAAESLIAYVDDSEKAREICSLLPAEESPHIEMVRAHCLEFLKQEMGKTAPKSIK